MCDPSRVFYTHICLLVTKSTTLSINLSEFILLPTLKEKKIKRIVEDCLHRENYNSSRFHSEPYFFL